MLLKIRVLSVVNTLFFRSRPKPAKVWHFAAAGGAAVFFCSLLIFSLIWWRINPARLLNRLPAEEKLLPLSFFFFFHLWLFVSGGSRKIFEFMSGREFSYYLSTPIPPASIFHAKLLELGVFLWFPHFFFVVIPAILALPAGGVGIFSVFVLLIAFLLTIYVGHVGRLGLVTVYLGLLKTPRRQKVLNFALMVADIAAVLLFFFVVNYYHKVAMFVQKTKLLKALFTASFLPHVLAAKAALYALANRFFPSVVLLAVLFLPTTVVHWFISGYADGLPLGDLARETNRAADRRSGVAGILSVLKDRGVFWALVRKDLLTLMRYRARDFLSAVMVMVGANSWLVGVVAGLKASASKLPAWFSSDVLVVVVTILLAKNAGSLLAVLLAVDREGKAFFSLLASPVSPRLILQSRLFVWEIGNLIISLFLGGLVTFLVKFHLATFFFSTVLSLVVSTAVGALWLTAGLFFPNFNWDNFAEVPTGRAAYFALAIEYVYSVFLVGVWLLLAYLFPGRVTAFLWAAIATVVVSAVMFFFFYREALWRVEKLESC